MHKYIQVPKHKDHALYRIQYDEQISSSRIFCIHIRDKNNILILAQQHTTLTRDRLTCHLRDSNPQSQSASRRRPTP